VIKDWDEAENEAAREREREWLRKATAQSDPAPTRSHVTKRLCTDCKYINVPNDAAPCCDCTIGERSKWEWNGAAKPTPEPATGSGEAGTCDLCGGALPHPPGPPCVPIGKRAVVALRRMRSQLTEAQAALAKEREETNLAFHAAYTDVCSKADAAEAHAADLEKRLGEAQRKYDELNAQGRHLSWLEAVTRAKRAERDLQRATAENDALVAELKAALQERDEARHAVGVARSPAGNVWFWQGGSADDSATLTCPVVMEAAQLRRFESAERDRDEARAHASRAENVAHQLERDLRAAREALQAIPHICAHHPHLPCGGCAAARAVVGDRP
jgi:hypothetical protein